MNHAELRSALEELANRNGGTLQPAVLVEEATNEASPLHAYFEWDDSEAGKLYREDQARSLIRSIKIEIKASEPISVRAFVSLPADRESGAGYRMFKDVIDNEFLRRQLGEEINQKIMQWQKKAEIYGMVCDFSQMNSIVEKLVA